MLAKSKKVGKITIYRKGIGYFLKLLQVINENGFFEKLVGILIRGEDPGNIGNEILILGIRIFTDIRNYKGYVKKKPAAASRLLMDIIRFNTRPNLFQGSEEKNEINIDDLAINVIDLFNRAGYGWTQEYILENIDFYTYDQYRDAIENRESAHYKMLALAFNDPKKLSEILDKAAGIERVSWKDLNIKQ